LPATARLGGWPIRRCATSARIESLRVTSRIDALQGDERWPGYDEGDVDEDAPSPEGDERRVKEGRAYERMRRPASVLEATERELSNA
jgi:hypothetical protein